MKKKKSCILFLAHQPSFQPLTSVNQFNYVNLVMNSLYTQKKELSCTSMGMQ